jgi:hypothetical protein
MDQLMGSKNGVIGPKWEGMGANLRAKAKQQSKQTGFSWDHRPNGALDFVESSFADRNKTKDNAD